MNDANTENDTQDDAQDNTKAIKRRDWLKTAGTTGIGLVGLGAASGTVSAGDTPDQLYFCGCSQVVVTGLNAGQQVTVYLRATEEGGCATATASQDCFVGGNDPNLNYAYRYTFNEGEAILAVGTPDGNIWCNPNRCAQKWLDELTCFEGVSGTLRSECTVDSELDPPGDVFTNGCETVCNN